MAIVLGANRYGKAETRVVRVSRDGATHTVTDLNVSIALDGDLAGSLAGSHLTGDNSAVLPTDSQKNTVYAFAQEYGVGQVESFALRLARHFVESQPSITRARVTIESYGWQRLGPHSFQRTGAETRTTSVTVDAGQAWVVSGLTDLVLMNTTDSEFVGFVQDRYTTLPEATDRVLATAVTARWRHRAMADGEMANSDWQESYDGARDALIGAFTGTYSRALQQTLYAMGSAVLQRRPEVVEVRLSLPNKHHLLVDLSRFGQSNPNEVFHADDRPYGLIQGTVLRDDAPPAESAWDSPWSW